jgi:hypothetical protein
LIFDVRTACRLADYSGQILSADLLRHIGRICIGVSFRFSFYVSFVIADA